MSLRRLIVKNRRKLVTVIGTIIFMTFFIFRIQIKEPLDEYKRLELNDEDSQMESNCTRIIDGDIEEIEQARLWLITVGFKRKPQLTNEHYIELTRNCENFKKVRKYTTIPLSKEEKEFPIAYSLVVHHKIDTFERLLRSVYAPQNYYCIHVDKKSPEPFLAAVKGIAGCFDNVFVASQLESVVYASWSRVQADINCMKDLYRMSTTWKYFINLCGLDFPIKTNFEIVGMLKGLNGKNSLETETMPQPKETRWKIHHEIVDGQIKRTDIKKSPPPIDSPVFSGGAYIVVTRSFVRHVIEEEKILKFIEWAKDTYSPDEFLWATLQRISSVPGSFPISSRYDMTDMNSIARFVKWSYFEGAVAQGAMYPPCTGIHVRSVCVYGVGDLNWMLQQHHLFANKFDTDVDPIAIQCLEEHLRHKSLISAAKETY